MDDLALNVLFNIPSVISGRLEGAYEGLCAMRRRLVLDRISLLAGLDQVTYDPMPRTLTIRPPGRFPFGCDRFICFF